MEDFETKKEYKGIIPIEQITANHINRIMDMDINKKLEEYEEGIEGLIDLLSPEHEIKALGYKKQHGVGYDISIDGKQRYRDLFRFIKRLLAEGNIVWKRSSYEMGKEDKHTKDENAIDIIDDVDEDIDKELSKYPEFKSDVID